MIIWIIYEQKYTKRNFNTHKSVCGFFSGSYHTTSQYLCIINKYQAKHINTFIKSYVNLYLFLYEFISYPRSSISSFNTLLKPLYLIPVIKPDGFEKVTWMIPLSTTTLIKQQSKQQISCTPQTKTTK